MLPQKGKQEGVSLPQKGKHTYEPPPKAVLQKSKLKLAQTDAECEPKVKEPARKQGPELEALLQCVSATWTQHCSTVWAGMCSQACRSQTWEAQAHRVGHQGGWEWARCMRHWRTSWDVHSRDGACKVVEHAYGVITVVEYVHETDLDHCTP